MDWDLFEGEDREVLKETLITLSGAIERIFSYFETAEQDQPVFKNEHTLSIMYVQILAQLLANHIDALPDDIRAEVAEFAKKQQELIITLRAEHYKEKPAEVPPEEDPYGLASMKPWGKA